jgi:hypothetical protein
MRRATLCTTAGAVITVALCAVAPVVTGADTTVRVSTGFSSPGEHNFTVPAGVTSLIVTAIGGTGHGGARPGRVRDGRPRRDRVVTALEFRRLPVVGDPGGARGAGGHGRGCR